VPDERARREVAIGSEGVALRELLGRHPDVQIDRAAAAEGSVGFCPVRFLGFLVIVVLCLLATLWRRDLRSDATSTARGRRRSARARVKMETSLTKVALRYLLSALRLARETGATNRGCERTAMIGELQQRELAIASWLRPQARGIASPLTELTCIGTRVGTLRKHNQDRVLCARFSDGNGGAADAFVVCDGIGGLEHGADCAETAIAAFVLVLAAMTSSGVPLRVSLRAAAEYANQRVYELFGGHGGTTLAAVVVHAHDAFICSVGDTRVFAVRDASPPATGADLEQLTPDDTLQGALDALGQKGTEPSPEHHKLLQFIGMGPDVEPHLASFGDAFEARFFLVCTDGAYRLPSGVAALVARNATTARQLVERLLECAEWFGVGDDATAATFASQFLESTPHNNLAAQTLVLWGVANSSMHMFIDVHAARAVRNVFMHGGASLVARESAIVVQTRANRPPAYRVASDDRPVVKEVPNAAPSTRDVPRDASVARDIPFRSEQSRTKAGKKRRDQVPRPQGRDGEVIIGPAPDVDDNPNTPRTPKSGE